MGEYQNYISIGIQIGIIALSIFGVRILLRLYSYNIRMALFFQSQADAIELKDIGKEKLEQLSAASKLLRPNNIVPFEKLPSHPYRDVVDLAKKIVDNKVNGK